MTNFSSFVQFRVQTTFYIVCFCPRLLLCTISDHAQPHSNRWWCHDIGYPLLDAEHSLCMAPWSGTPCRTTSAHSRTVSPLGRAWKPGFSPDTSMFSALETFVIIALYKSTFTIPHHTMPRAKILSFIVRLQKCIIHKNTITDICSYAEMRIILMTTTSWNSRQASFNSNCSAW